MKYPFCLSCIGLGLGMFASSAFAQTAPTTPATPAATPAAPASAPAATPSSGPYKVINTAQFFEQQNGIDYVYADSDGRRLYVPQTRAGQVLVFDLDTLKQVGAIPNTRGVHGVAVDPVSHHGFCSSNPVVMWDTQTLQTIKTIPVDGGPDGILFEPATERVYILSHRAPNVTAINAKDGTIAGTIDLGGAPEQAASDGKGHVYVDIEDGDNVAVVDANTMNVTAHYALGGLGSGPGGLGLDAKNQVLFAFCHDPATCVILSAVDGKVLTSLPTGTGTDGGGFNPDTMEAFSSQGDGTLTIIKENSPTSFQVEQNVATKTGAKTCTLDAKTDHIVLITTERAPASVIAANAPAPAPAAAATTATPAVTPAPATPAPATVAAAATAPGAPPAPGAGPDQLGQRRGGRGGRGGGPGYLDILVVGQ
jgi:DNA-binding beta-propeller fold protein YncE